MPIIRYGLRLASPEIQALSTNINYLNVKQSHHRVIALSTPATIVVEKNEDETMQAGDSVEKFLVEWVRERPDLDPWPAGILGRIHRLSARLLRRSEDWLEPLGLNWEAFSVIVTLRRSGKPYELRPTDILRESLLTSGAITNRIDRVERMGLVERRPDKADRRSCMVRLTPKGKRLADKAIADHFEALSRILGVLASHERDQFARLLAKLLGSLESADTHNGSRGKQSHPSHRMPTHA